MRHLLVLLPFRLFSWLPLRACHAIGGSIGLVFYWLKASNIYRISKINLDLCFPEKTAMEREQLLRENMIETGKMFAELGPIWLWTPEKLIDKVVGSEGFEHFIAARDRGKGIIALAPHLGQWELYGLFLPDFIPTRSLYKRPKMSKLNRFFIRTRERNGNRLVPTTRDGVREVYEALARNELVTIMPDQDPGKGAGLFSPLFGQPAWTTTFVARMIQRSDASVLVAYIERLPRGQGYRAHIFPAPEGINDPSLQTSVDAMNTAIEDCIRRNPSQYIWMYPRFKTCAGGQPNVYQSDSGEGDRHKLN